VAFKYEFLFVLVDFYGLMVKRDSILKPNLRSLILRKDIWFVVVGYEIEMDV
jgi:hypothetical protein